MSAVRPSLKVDSLMPTPCSASSNTLPVKLTREGSRPNCVKNCRIRKGEMPGPLSVILRHFFERVCAAVAFVIGTLLVATFASECLLSSSAGIKF